MNRRALPRTDSLRRTLAQEAARLMAEHGIRDFLTAKRKAAERLGVFDAGKLPRNHEIQDALVEYQRLFGGEEHARALLAKRSAAIAAMNLLAEFRPRLVGAVLLGTASSHNDIQLHLFADRAETVSFFLFDREIPHEFFDRRMKYSADRVIAHPGLRFEIGDQLVEAVVFSHDGIRQAPMSVIDGKPMRRADAAEVRALVGQAELTDDRG
ncbi:MAG: hypothetical protein KDI32_07320 [Pseudomonadales bacterium]|nr:hypothetical protein [Pseudomonadales bacterium]